MNIDAKGVTDILEDLYGESPFYFKSQINHAAEEYNNLLGIAKEKDPKIKVNVILGELKPNIGIAEIELDHIESENKDDFHKRLEETICSMINNGELSMSYFSPDTMNVAKAAYTFNGEFIIEDVNAQWAINH